MLSLALLSVVTTTASASIGNFSFNLKAGERQSSSSVKKTDSIQYAGVTTTGGDIISSDEVYMRVRNANSQYATEVKRITSNNANYTLYFTEEYGQSQRYYYLYAQSDKLTVKTSGRWEP